MTALILTAILAVPASPNAPAPIPDLRGNSTWGPVEQKGNYIWINGGANGAAQGWHGEGEIQKDGRLLFSWMNGTTPAWGEYRIEGKTLRGTWGWANGQGEPSGETITISVLPPGPER